MSRIANVPVSIPSGVDISINGNEVIMKGGQGSMNLSVHESVRVVHEGDALKFIASKPEKTIVAMAGTMRAIVNNGVIGVSEGWEKKLQLSGVGYRAQVKGKVLNLSLGFSHAVDYEIPEGITIETPSQTDIIVKGIDKQRVGQVAAEIRAWRPPEPYKGKGVKYIDEHIVRKEAKKK